MYLNIQQVAQNVRVLSTKHLPWMRRGMVYLTRTVLVVGALLAAAVLYSSQEAPAVGTYQVLTSFGTGWVRDLNDSPDGALAIQLTATVQSPCPSGAIDDFYFQFELQELNATSGGWFSSGPSEKISYTCVKPIPDGSELLEDENFDLSLELSLGSSDRTYRLFLSSDYSRDLGAMFTLHYVQERDHFAVMSAFLLVGLVLLLISLEIVSRVLTSLAGALFGVALLSYFRDQVSFEEVVSWVDFETLCVLFCMMVMVGVLSDTGLFEWLAEKARGVAGERIWLLVTLLSLLTMFFSAFLDNVTTMLLITPVAISLFRELEINPVPVLLLQVFLSNIAGAATPIGDPPSLLIVNDERVKREGSVTYATYLYHMAPIVLIVCICVFLVSFLLMRRRLRREPNALLDSEIELWKRSIASLDLNEHDADEAAVLNYLNMYVEKLESTRKAPNAPLLSSSSSSLPLSSNPPSSLGSLASSMSVNLPSERTPAQLKHPHTLIGTTLVLACVILLFFTRTLIPWQIGTAWIALYGTMVVLVVHNVHDVMAGLSHVDFSTLFFLAGLFVMMEAIVQLGMIDALSDTFVSLVQHINGQEAQLAVGCLLLIWFSAVVSALIDNVPYTAAMIPLVLSLSDSLGLPLAPLLWSLSLGACFGGNGTLIASSANIVVSGICEQEGFRIGFLHFSLYGFPIVIFSCSIATSYVILFYVLFSWHEGFSTPHSS